MKQLLFIAWTMMVGSVASAQELNCTGTLKVDNVGIVSHEQASLQFTSAQDAVYRGPHASIVLGTEVPLNFKLNLNNSGYVANLSRGGHGGERNVFHINRIGEGDIEFVYEGSSGYLASGILRCVRVEGKP